MGGRRLRRLVQAGAVLTGVGTGLIGVVLTAYWWSAPRVVEAHGLPSWSVATALAADGDALSLFGEPAGASAPAARPDLMLKEGGDPRPVMVERSAILALPPVHRGALRISMDPAARQPLGDGLLIEVFVDGEAYTSALLGPAAPIFDAELRLVPALGPAGGELSPDGVMLADLVPAGEPALVRVSRLELDGEPAHGAVSFSLKSAEGRS